MRPIHKLNKTFTWTEKADKTFKKIKNRLSLPLVISFPDFSQLFTLTTDASNVACGTILMQEADNGKKKITAVASHSFNPMEQNWSTTEREAYAIKWAILKFDSFLRNHTFVVFTDHRSLTYLHQQEFNNAKIQCWQEEISCYKFMLEYVEGQSNVEADMLSRSYGWKETKTPADSTLAGRVFKVEGFCHGVWMKSTAYSSFPRPTRHKVHMVTNMADAFFAYHSTSTILTENCNHINIAAEQLTDNLLSKIIQRIQARNVTWIRKTIFRKHLQNFYLGPGTSVLMSRDSTHTPKLVLSYKLCSRFLYQAHDCINHSGVTW